MNPAAMAVAAMLGPQVAAANFNPVVQSASGAYPVHSSVQDPSVHYQQSVMSTLYGSSDAAPTAATTTSLAQQPACSLHNSNAEPNAVAVTQQAPISEPVVAENKQTNSQSSCDKTMISDHDDWSSSGNESKKRVKTSDGSQVVAAPAVECKSVGDTSHKEREVSNDNQSNGHLFKQNGTSGGNRSSSSSSDEDSNSKKTERSEEGEASDILTQPPNTKRPHLDLISSGQVESSSAVNSNGVVESSPKPGENSELPTKIECNNNNSKIETTTTNDCDNEQHQVSSAAKQSADNQQQSANGKCCSEGTCADHDHLAAQLSLPYSRQQQQQLFSHENITTPTAAAALSSTQINGNHGVNQLSTPALNHLHNHHHHLPQPHLMLNCDELSYDKLACFENGLNFKQQQQKRQLQQQQHLQQQLIGGDKRHHLKRQSSFQTSPPSSSSPLALNQNGNGLITNYNGASGGRMMAANVRASPIKLEVCREFLRNSCKRSERNCKFAHPPSHVLMRADNSGSISKRRRSCCFPTNDLQVVETKTMPANLNLNALNEDGMQYNGDASNVTSGLPTTTTTTQTPPASASEQHFVTVCIDFMKGRCSRSFKCR